MDSACRSLCDRIENLQVRVALVHTRIIGRREEETLSCSMEEEFFV